MADNFFSLPKNIQRSILSGAETKLNIRAHLLEKDIWICWVLQELFTLPVDMAFKGGTSLSKVFDLLKRFSEDVDITIDYRYFSPSTDITETISKTALKKLSDHLKESVGQYVKNIVLPHVQERLDKTFPNENFKINLSEDGEQLRIYYPSLFNFPESYLLSCVLIEFGGRNSTLPNESHLIKTLLSQAVTELDLPTAQVNVLSPLRTFWEKATLIHVECHRGRLLETPERLSRHWYDLAILTQSSIGQQAITDRSLLEDVLYHKKAFFNASYANYEDCLNARFRLIPQEGECKTLQADFSQMINAGMFYEEPMAFDEIIKILQNLEKNINTY